jgi:Lon protease-like protein
MPSLPLFPLGGTLLPGRRFPLQVFEERYVALLRHLIDSEGEEIGFGVVAIRQGYEVGDRTNELYAIGCLAVLDRVVQVSEGLYLVLTHGTERFRLDAIDDAAGTPWVTGVVTWLQDVPGDPATVAAQADAVRQAVESHALAVGVETSIAPDDPAEVAWWAAEALDLERDDRQRLLELPEVVARLGLVRRLARRETGLASRLGVGGGPGSAPPSLN